jgi:hypothetical protein
MYGISKKTRQLKKPKKKAKRHKRQTSFTYTPITKPELKVKTTPKNNTTTDINTLKYLPVPQNTAEHPYTRSWTRKKRSVSRFRPQEHTARVANILDEPNKGIHPPVTTRPPIKSTNHPRKNQRATKEHIQQESQLQMEHRPLETSYSTNQESWSRHSRHH